MARVLSPSHSLNPPRGRSVSGGRNIATARAPVSALSAMPQLPSQAASRRPTSLRPRAMRQTPSSAQSRRPPDGGSAVGCATGSENRWREHHRV